MSSLILRLLPLALLFFFFYSGKEKITNIGYQARDIAFEYKATIEIQEMVKILRLSLIDDPRPPKDLAVFLQQHSASKQKTHGVDPWGTEYVLQEETYSNGLTLQSCGPDQECGTDDDVKAVVRNEDGLLAGSGGNLDAIEEKLSALFGNFFGEKNDQR